MVRRNLKRTSDEDLSLESLFQKHESDLQKKAKYFFRKYDYKILSFEDLYQTICYLFCYAYRTWNKDRGEFEPYFKCIINRKMNDIIAGKTPPHCCDLPFSILKPEYLKKPQHPKDLDDEEIIQN
ncbi:sigma factor [Thermotoga sp. SG1]|uniref:sigma factor n=1 Tax=Thermotoga sp. SG1 TaxID=126739 RepID=UPI000C771325|nr:sigma factor [Thermotoga sp. SG1]PLV56759.1 hypothetical protein AS006_03935 [Thermotoga sp. SG1]